MDPKTARHLLEVELKAADEVAAAQREMLAQSTEDIFDELASVDQHQADVGTETYEREKALTILRMAEERTADILYALEKLEGGTYGRCETCGAAITEERLEARPDARFCQDHERDWELGRIGMVVPSLPASPPEPVEPGWRELDLLPEDDVVEIEPTLSAEEAAMHVEATDEAVPADETEAIEADASAEAEDARQRASQETLDDVAALEETMGEEDRLDRDAPGVGAPPRPDEGTYARRRA